MVRLVTLILAILAILALILAVDAYAEEDFYKFFRMRLDICQQPPQRGNCKYDVEGFYYNFEKRKCLPFIFSGCYGNLNRFQTVQRCNEICVKYSYLLPESIINN